MARQLFVLQSDVSDGACNCVVWGLQLWCLCAAVVLVLLGAVAQYTWNSELDLVIGCIV